MSKKIEIGAPSITGIDSNDVVNDLFVDAKFPLKARLLNHLPRNVSLPEVNAFLKPIDGKAEIKIADFDELHRLVSSIEQIAELNKHELAITLVDLSVSVIEPPATESQKEPLKTAKTTTTTTAATNTTIDPVTPAATVGG